MSSQATYEGRNLAPRIYSHEILSDKSGGRLGDNTPGEKQSTKLTTRFRFVNSQQCVRARARKTKPFPVPGSRTIYKAGRVSFRRGRSRPTRSVWIWSQPIEPTGTPVPTQRASIKGPNGKGLCRVMATLQKVRRRGRDGRTETWGGSWGGRGGERWTGPGTILKGLIKPAKCHAATHVPSRRSEKIRPRCSETRQLVYRTHHFFRFFNFTTPSGIFARASHCAWWRISRLYSETIILRCAIICN